MINCNVNGIKVFDHGNEDSQTLLFVHAFPMNNKMWENQVEYFKDRYHVITYDLRSFGQSSSNGYNFTIDSYVDDLLEIIDQLKINKPILCGLSMGGYIALRTLERAQDIFMASVLCDTKSEADTNEAKLKRSEQIKQIKSGGRNKFVDGFILGALGSSSLRNISSSTSPEKITRDIIIEQDDKCICSALMTLGARTDTTAFLEKIKIPVLIIVGEDDKLTPVENSINMNNNIPGSRLEKISQSGHFTNLEQPGQFNNAVESFIKHLM